ncbi:MAG: putative rane protein [Patescibacteria group bacterium]|jgi:putative membrane protein|nr:putative rane protein [Patescibacteria group bacterium]MDQ5962051.1 putative rane protein [Patescibacteria group bacterium]
MKIILHWLIITGAVLATPYVIDGISVTSFVTALIVAAILGFINTIIKPILTILTLPLNILTLGLFSLILNGLFFWLVASVITGFNVSGFKAAFLGALVVSVINWLGSKILKKDD